MADFEIKRGDRRPIFSVVLEDNFGQPGEAAVDLYDAEIEILWNDGKAETFPSGSYWTVLITEDID
jgi:hypothetical protein